ncbi:hypothetical protein [Polaromonas sp. YR568]|uniref:LIC_13387 family protein n=1 Tax=Polaromonas sp. YR568 TaxID=1855301 RepID=UPI0031382D34
MNTPALLIAASGAVLLVLGLLHLVFTFQGPPFDPRDPELKTRMMAVSPAISRQTTMWRAWIGFNYSHSFGAILFGGVWGYLALLQPALLFQSVFLLALGLVALLAYVVVGRIYWFSTPFRGIVLATLLYSLGLLIHFSI